MLDFFGIDAGMTVFDMNSATGYWSEILAHRVGPTGRVIAHNHPGARTALSPQAFARRYGNGRLPNVEQLFVPHDAISLADGTVDAVLMSLVYHDTYWHEPTVDWGPVNRHALLTNLRRALQPGGIVGVIDHHAAAGSEPRKSAHALHRINPAAVCEDFHAAGFALEAESRLLRNRHDDLSLPVFHAAVQGRTDRFVLRFRS
jgi:predicted methyltransferase